MPLYSVVESLLMVSQKIRPGSSLCHAAFTSWFQTSLARTVFSNFTFSFWNLRVNSASFSTALMNSSVILTEMFA